MMYIRKRSLVYLCAWLMANYDANGERRNGDHRMEAQQWIEDCIEIQILDCMTESY